MPENTNFRFIDKIGVELEGGWNRDTSFQIFGDGSVHTSARRNGEAHTNPASTKEALRDEIKLKHPDIGNNSCGMHVHISTQRKQYMGLLADSKFNNFYRVQFLQRINEYYSGKRRSVPRAIMDRFEGNNSYCRNQFRPQTQLYYASKADTRYSQWNFCFGVHRTVECRTLPALESYDKWDEAYDLVCILAGIVEDYLADVTAKDNQVIVEFDFTQEKEKK